MPSKIRQRMEQRRADRRHRTRTSRRPIAASQDQNSGQSHAPAMVTEDLNKEVQISEATSDDLAGSGMPHLEDGPQLADLDLLPSVIWAILDLDPQIRDAIVLRYGLRSEPFRMADIAALDGSSLDDVAGRIDEGKQILAREVGPQLQRYLTLMSGASQPAEVTTNETNPFVRLAFSVMRGHVPISK